MTDTQPDISEVPADAVAPAPSEAPYTDLTALAEGFDPSASTDEPAVTSVVSADTEPAPATEPASTEKAPRRARTELESRVKTVCDEFVAGGFTLGDGETLTPHRIARRLEDGDAKVSTGAVASVLTRWDGYGFATVNEKPLAFVDYTDAGRTEGLTALKAAHAAKAKADKAAIKAAEASAAT